MGKKCLGDISTPFVSMFAVLVFFDPLRDKRFVVETSRVRLGGPYIMPPTTPA